MKKFLRFVMEWKTGACFLFTGMVILYLIFCLILGETTVTVPLLWTLVLVSAAGTLIQTLCFTQLILKRIRYTWRLTLFCLLFFPVLAVVAWAFQWFPMDGGSWLVSAGIFLLIFLVMTAGFEIYFRATGRRYDGLLGQYRKEREEEKE